MRRILRKGHSSVYLQYDYVGDSIGADNFIATMRKDIVVISFNLRPVDSNQKSDEDRLHIEELREIHLSDNYIIEKLSSFILTHSVIAKKLAAEITSRGKVRHFPIATSHKDPSSLRLVVQRQTS